MDNNQVNIEKVFREKLEQFQAAPPEHVWTGVEQALAVDKAPLFIFQFWKPIAAAAIIGLFALSAWYFLPESSSDQLSEIEVIENVNQSETESDVYSENDDESPKINNEVSTNKDEIFIENTTEINEATSEEVSSKVVSSGLVAGNKPNNSPKKNIETIDKREDYQLTHLENRESTSLYLTDVRNSYSESGIESTVNLMNRKTTPMDSPVINNNEITGFQNYWNIGLYFTPEMMLNNIDSITLMNTYSLNIEPSWYFSNHWFMRFGAGISYVRDQGFAKVDFISKDYMGSYDSVVDVTFEEIDDELFPVYHTQEVEIWDSIRHLTISEITNKYYYLQFPLMFGYHNSTNKLKWYFYGGPAVNISISEQIEDPKANIEYIDIINLENRLPNRVDYSLQIWVGAGIDFQIGQRFSVAVEPNYRYYFEPIYKEDSYKTALSGLGLRFGLVYKLDRK